VTVSEPCETKDECVKDLQAIKQYHDAEIEDLTIDTHQALREEGGSSEPSATNLILYNPAQDFEKGIARKGAILTFTGFLLCGTHGIAGVPIMIMDNDRSFRGADDLLSSGITDMHGTFSIDWIARDVDWLDTMDNVFDTVEVYARFEGTPRYQPAISKQYTFFVRDPEAVMF
jgi:hypothetical protein